MKSKFAAWSRLTAEPYKNRTPIAVIKLPGFRALEDALIGLRPTDPTPVGFDAQLYATCKAAFGIDPDDLFPPEPERLRNLPDDHPSVQGYLNGSVGLVARYKVDGMDDVGAVSYLLPLGIDLRSENGQPLRLTPHLSLLAEHVARHFGGTMPDINEVGIEEAETRLADEARRWKSARRAR